MTVSSDCFEHRATVVRNSTSTTNAHGHPNAPSYGAHMTLDCRVYNNKKTLINDGDKNTSQTQLRIAWRFGEDIVTTTDRITAITDRNSSSLYAQTFEMKNPVRRDDHWEADLEEFE